MGNYLSAPNAEKITQNAQVWKYRYGACSMQGWRTSMEDDHILHHFQYLPAIKSPAILIGVFDGHGGSQVARFVARHIVNLLLNNADFHQGNFEKAFQTTYITLDEMLAGDGAASKELEYLLSESLIDEVPRSTFTRKGEIIAAGERVLQKIQQPNNENIPTTNKVSNLLEQGHVSNGSKPQNDQVLQQSLQQSSQNKDRGDTAAANLGGGNIPVQETFQQNRRGFKSLLGALGRIVSFSKNNGAAEPAQAASKARHHQLLPLSYNHPATCAGSTAVSVLVTDKRIIVANAGDSRCVLCRNNTAIDLSKDHKPTLPEEQSRVYSAGGWLEMGRINGNLNLSRAIGDLMYKTDSTLPPDRQIISSFPDVVSLEVTEADQFLVGETSLPPLQDLLVFLAQIIGCDGIWETSSSQDIVDFVRMHLDSTKQLSDVLELLFNDLLSPNPSLFEYGCDNMTAIILDLQPHKRPMLEPAASLLSGLEKEVVEAHLVESESVGCLPRKRSGKNSPTKSNIRQEAAAGDDSSAVPRLEPNGSSDLTDDVTNLLDLDCPKIMDLTGTTEADQTTASAGVI